MNRRVWGELLIGGLASGGTAAAVQDKPAAAAALTPAQAERWAVRIRQVILTPGWTVTPRGDAIVVQRTRPVRFAPPPINAPPQLPGEPEPVPPLTPGPYRFTLRFVRKLSFEEYEALADRNAAGQREAERLRDSVRHISHKFDDYFPSGPAEEAQLKAYRAAISKFTWHGLPDLYSPDHAVHLVHSWPYLDYVYDKQDARECQETYDVVLRFFGKYDWRDVAGRISPIREQEPPPPR